MQNESERFVEKEERERERVVEKEEREREPLERIFRLRDGERKIY